VDEILGKEKTIPQQLKTYLQRRTLCGKIKIPIKFQKNSIPNKNSPA
jgi:hypothetical protein